MLAGGGGGGDGDGDGDGAPSMYACAEKSRQIDEYIENSALSQSVDGHGVGNVGHGVEVTLRSFKRFHRLWPSVRTVPRSLPLRRSW